MQGKDLRILFMGTPEFAVASLRALVEGGYNVVGVVTMPDKPSGRGLKMNMSAVKIYAQQQGLTLLQPEKLRDEAFLAQLRDLRVDLGVVIAFRMLPEVVWAMPALGTFNLHSSLLPLYRGAAPINWAVINGDRVTGVTTFMLNHEIDKGDVISRAQMTIERDDTAGTLHDRLMVLGSQLVVKSVDMIATAEVKALPQIDSAELKPAPKIFKEDCHIDFSSSVESVYNFVRGLSPYPAAWTTFGWGSGAEESSDVKIYFVEPVVEPHHRVAGSIESDGKRYIRVYCADGYVTIDQLQVAGKRRMSTEEFLRGFKFASELRIK